MRQLVNRRKRMSAADRREQILNFAWGIVSKDGFVGLTMDRLARQAGITRALIYQKFGNLDGVVQEVIHRRYEVGIFQFLEAARLAAASDENPFIFIFSKLLEAVDNDPANWKLLLKTPEGAPAILLTLLDKGRDVSKAALKTHVESLVRQHDNGKPTVDIELNVHLMQVVAEELLRLRLEEPDNYSHERLLNQIRLMTDMLMRDIEA